MFSPHLKGLISVYFNFSKHLALNKERARKVDPQSHLLSFISYWGKLDRLSARNFLDLLKIAEFVKIKENKKAKMKRFTPRGHIGTVPCMKALMNKASREHAKLLEDSEKGGRQGMSLESFLVEEVAPWEEKLQAKDPLPKNFDLGCLKKSCPSFVGEDLKTHGPSRREMLPTYQKPLL